MKAKEIKFRAWDESRKYMAYQGTPDLETIQSFMHHFGDKKLLQFTGLHDKNGKEIYKGDILSDRWKVEVYQNNEGTFMVKFHTNPKGNKPRSLKLYLAQRLKAYTAICEGYRDCLVIGNIYENPELLSVK
jgi:uncharacterized phage protein (TIGR01671 family)